MARKPKNKITKYPMFLHINVGIVFFAFILVYVIICVFMYFNKKHIVGYEVREGSLSSNNIYEAVALRSESIVTAANAGYVNYFAPEGQRVAVGNLVYTVDESGDLLDYLKTQGTEQASLTNEDLSELRSQIVSYSADFDPKTFSTVYDFKNSLDGTVQKLASASVLQSINSLNNNAGALNSINYCYSQGTGIVQYYVDGYEDLNIYNMTSDLLDNTKYERKQLISNALVGVGDPVFKLSTNEDWMVVIKENDLEKVNALAEKEYVKVRFLKNQDEAWGKVSYVTNDSGDTFVGLSFTNSMITFVKDRFLSVELITEDESGLKIPNSSIAEKSFFVIPKEYVTKGNNNNSGVLRDKYDENGNETSEFIEVELYNENEDSYYVDDSTLRNGDLLIKLDSQDKFTVNSKDTLIGVYNINKGYADFRQISILYQNDEYAIVKSNTNYGLNVYDYIVLDASTVEGDAKNLDTSEEN
ncbi:HlyD family efflux transporter periplasmic adaptor subunit [Butyrivibrio sp. AE3004]|uniref:HlyD family efflux transporter periplasmic adaptor subunit n=1 Tax=Butyrivibrio sp. AE3004 TaxID=1506994 RepID=UPI000494149B|nr:HlyD family efflux transporter periplasmic adaptor subunit [Butyrivibrio sp. AE3004]